MITKNSDGNALIAEYGDYIKDEARALDATLYMNGDVLTGELDDFKIVKGSCGTLTDFTVGNIVSSQFTATIEDLEDAVKGETIEVRIGLELPDESYEWVTLGFFIINDVRTMEDVSVITGHGVLTSASGTPFTVPATQTLANIATNIGTGLGCTVTLDASIDDTLEVDSAMNGISVYQALQILTTLVGGYAIETNDGNVKICVYDDTPTLTVSTDITETPRLEADDFSITGVKCRVSEASSSSSGIIPAVEYSHGTVNLDMSSRYMTQDLFDDMYPNIIGYTYRPASVVMLLGDPRLEGSDVIQLEHYDEETETTETYIVPCHKLTHYYDGGLCSVIQGVKASDIDMDIGTLSPFQTAMAEVNAEVVTAKYNAENAVEIATDTAQYFWVSNDGTDNGAHITQIPAEEFVADPENGGGNTLINTNGMAVRDGLTELGVFSAEQIRLGDFDGGNIVIVPTGFNINNAGIQLATFDTEDGIMFKTQQGAAALSVAGEGELVTRTIKDVVSLKEKILSVRSIMSPGTRTSETVIGSAYPTDKTLTVRTSNLYVSSGSYSNHTITYSEDDDTVVQIGSYTYSANITIKAYLVWLTTGELVLRIQKTNSGALTVYSDRNLFVDVVYVSYPKDVYIPKISTDGHLYLYGHSTPVGDLMDVSTSDYSYTYSSGSSSWVYPQGDGTYLSENGLLLPAGRWVIQACIRLQTLTDGAQYGVGVGYGDSRANATMALASRQIVTAGSTSAIILNTTHLADASGSNRYYVGLWHGSKATVTYMSIKAMRVR